MALTIVTYQAWPYLVGKSKTRDIQVILTSPILHAANMDGTVWGVSSDKGMGTVLYREIFNAGTKGQKRRLLFSIIYRLIYAHASYIDTEYTNGADPILSDNGNRAISLFEGAIFPPDQAIDLQHLPIDLFESIRKQTISAFKQFWMEPGSQPLPVQLSTPIMVGDNSGNSTLFDVTRIEPFIINDPVENLPLWPNITDQPQPLLASQIILPKKTSKSRRRNKHQTSVSYAASTTSFESARRKKNTPRRERRGPDPILVIIYLLLLIETIGVIVVVVNVFHISLGSVKWPF